MMRIFPSVVNDPPTAIVPIGPLTDLSSDPARAKLVPAPGNRLTPQRGVTMTAPGGTTTAAGGAGCT